MSVAIKSVSSTHVLSVRPLRKWLGLTQTQFAKVIGVGRATVVRWETGAGGPSPDTAEGRLVQALWDIKSLATKAFGREAQGWLHDRAPTLRGATPHDTLIKRGPIPVLTILRAGHEGAYL